MEKLPKKYHQQCIEKDSISHSQLTKSYPPTRNKGFTKGLLATCLSLTTAWRLLGVVTSLDGSCWEGHESGTFFLGKIPRSEKIPTNHEGLWFFRKPPGKKNGSTKRKAKLERNEKMVRHLSPIFFGAWLRAMETQNPGDSVTVNQSWLGARHFHALWNNPGI